LHVTTIDKTAPQSASTQWQFIQVFLFIYFVVFGLMLFAYVAKFGMHLSAEHDRWGQFGDFLGGILNPLTSFFTLIVAVFVWRLQSKELTETRAVLNEQTQINRLTFADQMLMYHLDAISSCLNQIKTTVVTNKEKPENTYGDDALTEQLIFFKNGSPDFKKGTTDLDQTTLVMHALKQWTPLYNAIRATVKYIEKAFEPEDVESRFELLRLRTTLNTQHSICYHIYFTKDSDLLAATRRADLLKYFQTNEAKEWLYGKADF
jgi:hypothetical protein